MLATLDSYIAQDRGGRRLFLFRQLWCLFLTIGPKCDDVQTAVFDSVLATAAHDVDYSIITELAAEAEHLPYGLPVLAAALTGKPVTPLVMLPPAPSNIFEDAPPMPGEQTASERPAEETPVAKALEQPADHAEPLKTELPENTAKPAPVLPAQILPGQMQTAVVHAERRAQPRDPAEDAANPITLARKASLEELARIADLPNLPEAITNVIVGRGDRLILGKALANQTAAFARSSLTTLAELAPSDRMIREALVLRKDLPEPIIERLLPFLSLEKRAALLTNGAQFSEAAARDALMHAQADLLNAARAGHLMMTIDGCDAMLEEGKLNAGDIILILAKDLRVAELATFVATRLAIREATAFNILSGRVDHPVAVLIKALNCDGRIAEQVMVMRNRLGCRDAKETRSAFMVAQRYSVEGALDLVRCMDTVIQIPAGSDATEEQGLLAGIDAILRRAA
jgi:hypothetical protein